MEATKRIVMTGPGVPVPGDDIDTDRIIPARYLRTIVFDGLGDHAFEDDRKELRQQGKTHPFDDPRFFEARILLVNSNFGCGSSREHAPQALWRWQSGIEAIVGESFAEIFFGNCVAMGIPCVTVDKNAIEALMQKVRDDPTVVVSVDLERREVRAGTDAFPLGIPDGTRQQLLRGRWDSTTELLANVEAVKERAASLSYFNEYAHG